MAEKELSHYITGHRIGFEESFRPPIRCLKSQTSSTPINSFHEVETNFKTSMVQRCVALYLASPGPRIQPKVEMGTTDVGIPSASPRRQLYSDDATARETGDFSR